MIKLAVYHNVEWRYVMILHFPITLTSINRRHRGGPVHNYSLDNRSLGLFHGVFNILLWRRVAKNKHIRWGIFQPPYLILLNIRLVLMREEAECACKTCFTAQRGRNEPCFAARGMTSIEVNARGVGSIRFIAPPNKRMRDVNACAMPSRCFSRQNAGLSLS